MRRGKSSLRETGCVTRRQRHAAAASACGSVNSILSLSPRPTSANRRARARQPNHRNQGPPRPSGAKRFRQPTSLQRKTASRRSWAPHSPRRSSGSRSQRPRQPAAAAALEPVATPLCAMLCVIRGFGCWRIFSSTQGMGIGMCDRQRCHLRTHQTSRLRQLRPSLEGERASLRSAPHGAHLAASAACCANRGARSATCGPRRRGCSQDACIENRQRFRPPIPPTRTSLPGCRCRRLHLSGLGKGNPAQDPAVPGGPLQKPSPNRCDRWHQRRLVECVAAA